LLTKFAHSGFALFSYDPAGMLTMQIALQIKIVQGTNFQELKRGCP
jgi:hypothetical protein